MIVFLNRVDRESNIYTLKTGEHVIGRGELLECSSLRVSRNHGIIRVTKNDVILISTHSNPCFYQSNETRHMEVITNGSSVSISNGDKIALLPDEYWFKVRIEETTPESQNVDELQVVSEKSDEFTIFNDLQQNANNSNEMIDYNDKSTKRGYCGNVEQSYSKRQKSTMEFSTSSDLLENVSNINNDTQDVKDEFHVDVTLDQVPIVQNHVQPSEIQQQDPQKVVQERQSIIDSSLQELKEIIQDTNSVNEPIIQNSSVQQESTIEHNLAGENSGTTVEVNVQLSEDVKVANIIIDKENKTETNNEHTNDKGNTDDTNTKDKPSTSGNNTVHRDRCWYGGTCYRKNMEHKTEFSHPGDPDYDSDPNDSRPLCPYGPACYRKNKDHRKRYRHPGNWKNNEKNATRHKKRAATRKDTKYKSDSDDSYEYSDPFLDDGSSDEFLGESNISESDDDIDDEEEEDSQETKRLLREAKKFMKGRKKDK